VLAATGVWAPVAAATALAPPLVLLAATAPAVVARQLPVGDRRTIWVRAALVLALVAAVLTAFAPAQRRAEARRLAFDRDRLEAGRWLAARSDAAESLATGSRWVLAGAPALARPAAGGAADYRVAWGRRAQGEIEPPAAPAGYLPLAIFDDAYRRFDDLPWVTVFALPATRAAETGARAFTLRDLGAPAALPGVPPPKKVEWRGANLFEHPSGGVRFLVPCEGRRFSVRFRPAFQRDTPRDGSDGVVFELRAGGLTRFRTFLYPTDPVREHVVRVVDGRAGEEATLDLLTGVGPAQDGRHDWALWRDVRIQVEGAPAGPVAPTPLVIDEQAPEPHLPATAEPAQDEAELLR
jgi:hypothetical protein